MDAFADVALAVPMASEPIENVDTLQNFVLGVFTLWLLCTHGQYLGETN